MSQLSLFGKCVVEFIGSFLLGCIAGFRPSPAAVCASLVCVIYMGFDLSGAHYNPSLTLTFFMRGLTTIPEFVTYIPMQLLGCISGAGIGRAISGLKEVRFRPGAEHTLAQAMSAEILFTFAMCYCLQMIALRNSAKFNPVFGCKSRTGFTKSWPYDLFLINEAVQSI